MERRLVGRGAGGIGAGGEARRDKFGRSFCRVITTQPLIIVQFVRDIQIVVGIDQLLIEHKRLC